jgi:hypothetical protein
MQRSPPSCCYLRRSPADEPDPDAKQRFRTGNGPLGAAFVFHAFEDLLNFSTIAPRQQHLIAVLYSGLRRPMREYIRRLYIESILWM